MKTARSILLAIAATLGASGCRAWNPGSLSPSPRPLAERTLDVDEFVAEHNRNADRIQSLEARPTIGVGGRMKARVDGKLALERPRNFKLELQSVGGIKKADIGSNDEEFWFWVSNDKDKAVYWCNYADLDASSLAVTYQPDWIIEALGLKSITPAQAARIKVREGDVRGTTALVFPPSKSGGETYSRMMIVWNHNRRIKQHRIYAGNLQSPAATAKSLLAQADVSRYMEFDAGSSQQGDGPKCYLPESVKLEWKRDQLILDVLMQEVQVNKFESSRSTALFVEPVIPGHERVNLAELSRAHGKDTRTTVRQTLPPPAPRNGVELGRPTPAPDDTTMAPRGRTTLALRSRGPTTSLLEELVRPPLPVTPDTAATQSAAATSPNADFYQIER